MSVRVPVPVILLLVLILTAVVLDGLWRERSRRCLAWRATPSQQLLTEVRP